MPDSFFKGRLAAVAAEMEASAPCDPPDLQSMTVTGVMEWTLCLPRCQKGLCVAPATRYASYYSGGLPVSHVPSCYQHGAGPFTARPDSAAVTLACGILASAGRAWWLPGR
jgi:hypothetical protein